MLLPKPKPKTTPNQNLKIPTPNPNQKSQTDNQKPKQTLYQKVKIKNKQGEGAQNGGCWARLHTMLLDCDSVVEAYIRSLIAAGLLPLSLYSGSPNRPGAFPCKVDGFAAETQGVDLRIVGKRG